MARLRRIYLMLALCFDGNRVRLGEVAAPVPGPDEALIRVKAAGICRTDLEIARGYMAFRGVLGHEFVGVVEESRQTEWIGKRVVGEINLGCGRCRFCREGLSRHCPDRRVLGIAGKDGALAEYLTLPVANLHEVPDATSVETAVFAEPVAACFEILEQVEVAGRKTAVLGDGKLGILAARVLKSAGVKDLLLVGRHRAKLSLVERGGIRTCLAEEFPTMTARPEDKYDLVVDEVTLIGSRCGPFEPALAALAGGTVRVDDLVSARFPLARAEEAMATAARAGELKVIIAMHPGPS